MEFEELQIWVPLSMVRDQNTPRYEYLQSVQVRVMEKPGMCFKKHNK